MGLIIVNVKVYLTELKNLKVLKSSASSPDNLFESQKKDFFFFTSSHPVGLHPQHSP